MKGQPQPSWNVFPWGERRAQMFLAGGDDFHQVIVGACAADGVRGSEKCVHVHLLRRIAGC
ncbi:MAG: hypothetical protein ACREOS_02875, partial [Candidatus Dormibacteraceae bacterium]